jgi:hypothetical protein
MKYIKLFEKFTDNTFYGKFFYLDISDIHEITFIWSNHPFFGDYKENGFFGSPEKRYELTKLINKTIKEKGYTKQSFKKLLLEKDFDVIEETNNNYKLKLKNRDVVMFFHLVETL